MSHTFRLFGAALLALALPILCAPSTGLAQNKKTAQTDDCARAKKQGKKCKLIAIDDGDDVTGGVASATGSDIRVIKPVTYSSLIHVRLDFIDKIVRTGDEI